MNFRLNKKLHNQYPKNKTYINHFFTFGQFAIKALHVGVLNESRLENLERLINKKLKFFKQKIQPKYWCFIHLSSSTTKLSPESRMGKGKGSVSSKIAYVKPGQILFEFHGLSFHNTLKLHEDLKNYLPFKTRLVVK